MLDKRSCTFAVIMLSALLSLNVMTSVSFAAVPVLVKDINTQPAGSSPQNLANSNGTLFFSANTGTSGWELITSDGTTTGTVLVKDINPGIASSSPAGFVQLGGFTYFAADDGANGRELWRTDGTESGTTLVTDINPGPASSNPGQFTVLGGAVYFIADDGVHGPELWKTDGAITTLVKDINITVATGSNIQNLKTVGTKLFFWANDGVTGQDLWTSDGSTAGTQRVADLAIYPYSPIYDLNGKALFAANDGYTTYGTEPWISDGTGAGTSVIRDVTPGTDDGFHGSEFGLLNGYAYFMGGTLNPGSENLYRTDGTFANTGFFNAVRLPSKFTTVGSTLYFVGYQDASGLYSIWKTDGSTANLVATPNTHPYYNSFNLPASLVDINGTLYFTSPDSTLEPAYPTTYYLWKSDGVTTVRVTTKVSYPQNLTNVNGILYFTANDGVNGPELWRSDGTDAGTYMLKVNTASTASTTVAGAVQMNGIYYFAADDGVHGTELWRSDGTDAGTQMVLDIVPGVTGSSVSNLTAVGGTLFFTACDATYGCELWKSDGTAGGTSLVTDILPGAGGSYPYNLVNIDGTLFFAADDGVTGYELWKSDGTPAGTMLVKDIYPGSYNSSYPSYLTKVNGTLFFTADDGVNGNELWKSDGTPAGTVMVKDIYPGGSSYTYPYNLININGTLFFTADDGVNGYELWKSDGTPVGTVMVKNINPGPLDGSDPSYFTNLNGILYFTANDGTNGYQLWKSDGTNAGTTPVTTINPGFFNPELLTWVNGKLFFRANDGTAGVELWMSDGTTIGTVMVKDIFPGAATNSSYPDNLVNVNGMLLFTADDGVHGIELWQSDGTAVGTTMVQDINVDPLVGSNPNNLMNVQGTLFFFANDGQHGNELMTYQLTNSNPPTVVSSYPVPGAANVSPGTSIVAVFSEAMDPATINASTFTVSGTTGTVIYEGPNTATFIPSSVLSYGATYTVTITTGAKDLSGVALASDYQWSFTTEYPVLKVTKKGSGSGMVTSDIGGIICGATCSAGFNPGDIVTLTAAPDTGMTFIGWSGACTGTGSCVVTMNVSKTVSATFSDPNWAFIETFDSLALPAGWTVVRGIWDFNYFAPNTTGGSGGYGYSNYWDVSELWMPILDLSSMTAPRLEFKTDYYSNVRGSAQVDVSVNGGASWTPVWSPGSTDFPGPKTIQLDLSSIAAGQSAVQIRFLFVNNDSSAYWAIDDVKVNNYNMYAITVTAGAGGTVSPGSTMVSAGSTAMFTVIPNIGYTASVGGSCGGTLAGIYYTTNTITGPCTVDVTFVDMTPPAVGMDITQTYKAQWGSLGSGDGQFNYPSNIAVDASGNVYVSDSTNNRIEKFSANGAYVAQWGSYGSGDGQFATPLGIAVDGSGNVYVADSYNHRIQKFDPNGTYLTQRGSNGTGDGQFNNPCGLAIDGNGNVYVADMQNSRIQKFSSDGTFLAKWGSVGTGDGQFGTGSNGPRGVAVDAYANVYVADFGNNRIQKFSPNGTYLTQWGTPGPGDGQFSQPYGVGVDSAADVYVADMKNSRIQKFTSSGVFLTKWGSVGTGNGQFGASSNGPRGVAVDGLFNVYVVDQGNQRIQKFVPWAATSTTPNGSYAQGSLINISIAFTEPVSSSGLTINLNSGASVATGELVSAMTWSGTYTVGAGENAPSLNIASVIGMITDGAGNSATDPLVPAGLNLADNKAIRVDTTAPTVQGTNPADNATNVPVNAALVATFSEDMDPATINDTTFLVSGVTGSVTYDSMSKDAIFTPSANLAVSTLYTATVTTGAKDLAGNALAASYTWTFTTGAGADTIPPTVQSVNPLNGATGVQVGTVIVATFSEDMLSSSLSATTLTLTGPSGAVAGSIVISGPTATFTPSSALASFTTYTATITTGAKDLAGNALAAPFIWSFTTADVIPPVTTAAPAGGSYAVTQVVTLSANEPATIYYTTDGAAPTAPATGSTLTSANTATITVITTTTIRFFGVDLAGNVETVIHSAVYIIDTLAPVTTATPTGGTYPAAQNVTLTANEPATIHYTVDGSDPLVTSPTYTVPILISAGTTTLKFFAVDLAGNVEVFKTRVYVIDTNMPQITNVAPASGSFVNSSTVSYTLSKLMAAGSVVFTRTSGTADPSSPHSYTMTQLTAGPHTVNDPVTLMDGVVYSIAFNATDGVTSAPTVTSTNVTYDQSAANITITSPTPGGRVNTPTVSYLLSEPTTSGRIVIDDGSTPFVTVLSGAELTAGAHTVTTADVLVNGMTYTFSITNVTDRAGNASAPAIVPNVTFDTMAVVISNTGPVTKSIITAPTVTYQLSEQAASGAVTFTRSGGKPDPASPHVITLSGSQLNAGTQTFTPPITLVDSAFYTVSFAATDMAGNAATTVSNALVFFDSQYGKGPVGNVDNTDGLNTVNNADVIKLQDALGTRPGDDRWNPVCDLDRNNVIDIRDLMILHRHYGETGP